MLWVWQVPPKQRILCFRTSSIFCFSRKMENKKGKMDFLHFLPIICHILDIFDEILKTHIVSLQHIANEIIIKNLKVFEQKGDLLNFKANIDPRAVLSWVKPGWAESSWIELSWAKSSWSKPSGNMCLSALIHLHIFFGSLQKVPQNPWEKYGLTANIGSRGRLSKSKSP